MYLIKKLLHSMNDYIKHVTSVKYCPTVLIYWTIGLLIYWTIDCLNTFVTFARCTLVPDTMYPVISILRILSDLTRTSSIRS